MLYSATNLIWIDLEMTGLDVDRDQVIEIATIVTDADLNVLAEGPVLAIHQPESVLAGMDEWNQTQHGGSGLLERVRQSVVDEREAERQTLRFLEQWVPAPASPLPGTSPCQHRRFLPRVMPELLGYFHYRHIDVSTLKELARRWLPSVAETTGKTSSHLALDDIRDSIAELRHYRASFLCEAARGG